MKRALRIGWNICGGVGLATIAGFITLVVMAAIVRRPQHLQMGRAR
jgi:hypothetical protein